MADNNSQIFVSDDDSENGFGGCFKKDNYSRTVKPNSHRSSVPTANSNGEMESMKQLLEDHRQRVDCLLNINCQLKNDFNKSVQTNRLLEQSLTCPYVENEGNITFPGKSDLDNRINGMFKELAEMKKDLKIAQNDKYLLRKLVKVLKLPLPSCNNRCHKNVNKTKLNTDE